MIWFSWIRKKTALMNVGIAICPEVLMNIRPVNCSLYVFQSYHRGNCLPAWGQTWKRSMAKTEGGGGGMAMICKRFEA
jgi:hypothetical protein